MSPFSLQGKVAFLTGAAQGLGRAMAEALAEGGAHLWLYDRDEKTLNATAQALRATGAEVTTTTGDVTDRETLEAAFEALEAHHGHLDICIANAGISDAHPGPLHEVRDDDWHNVLNVNLTGLFYTCRAALQLMEPRAQGKLITVASMWGLAAPAGAFPRPAYAASKGAVVNLTREMALHYATKNIQVNALCPGIFRKRCADPTFLLNP